MKLVTELLSNIFKTAFYECGYDETLGQVVVSNRLDLANTAWNRPSARPKPSTSTVETGHTDGAVGHAAMLHKNPRRSFSTEYTAMVERPDRFELNSVTAMVEHPCRSNRGCTLTKQALRGIS